MKTTAHFLFARTFSAKAFTFVEMMVSMGIFTMVVGVLMGSHIVGLKMNQMVQAKMGASDDARSALNVMTFEVQSADHLTIGQGTSNSFVELAGTNARMGNAIQVHLTSASNPCIRYFLVTNLSAGTNYGKLMRRSTNGTFKVIAENITNRVPFQIEYYLGGAITDAVPQNQMVLNMNFIFYQLQYPIVKLGTNMLFDYYEFRTKLTPRVH